MKGTRTRRLIGRAGALDREDVQAARRKNSRELVGHNHD